MGLVFFKGYTPTGLERQEFNKAMLARGLNIATATVAMDIILMTTSPEVIIKFGGWGLIGSFIGETVMVLKNRAFPNIEDVIRRTSVSALLNVIAGGPLFQFSGYIGGLFGNMFRSLGIPVTNFWQSLLNSGVQFFPAVGMRVHSRAATDLRDIDDYDFKTARKQVGLFQSGVTIFILVILNSWKLISMEEFLKKGPRFAAITAAFAQTWMVFMGGKKKPKT